MDVDEIRKRGKAGCRRANAQIQYAKNLSTGKETLRLTVPFRAAPKVDRTPCQKDFPQAQFRVLGLDQRRPQRGARRSN